METHRLEIRPLITRQGNRYIRDPRRSAAEISRCLSENHRQVSFRAQTSEHISEFYSSFYSYESSSKTNEDSAIYGPLKEFSTDFTSLLDNPIFSDVQIKCGGEVMKAHKNILSSRSPVFNAMFNNSMIESATGVVTIDDLDPQIIRDLLAFIYSNKVQNLSLMKALGLLEASTKYQIQTLKDICVSFLLNILTREHALLVLQKADLYDEKLKRCTLNFISEIFFDLRETEEWITMQTQNPVLALEVCNTVIDKLAAKQ